MYHIIELIFQYGRTLSSSVFWLRIKYVLVLNKLINLTVFENHNSTFDNCKFLPLPLRMELKVFRHGFTKCMKCLTKIKKPLYQRRVMLS